VRPPPPEVAGTAEAQGRRRCCCLLGGTCASGQQGSAGPPRSGTGSGRRPAGQCSAQRLHGVCCAELTSVVLQRPARPSASGSCRYVTRGVVQGKSQAQQGEPCLSMHAPLSSFSSAGGLDRVSHASCPCKPCALVHVARCFWLATRLWHVQTGAMQARITLHLAHGIHCQACHDKRCKGPQTQVDMPLCHKGQAIHRKSGLVPSYTSSKWA